MIYINKYFTPTFWSTHKSFIFLLIIIDYNWGSAMALWWILVLAKFRLPVWHPSEDFTRSYSNLSCSKNFALVLEVHLPPAQPRKLERAWNFPGAFLAGQSDSASYKTDFPTSEKKKPLRNFFSVIASKYFRKFSVSQIYVGESYMLLGSTALSKEGRSVLWAVPGGGLRLFA